MRVLGIETSCDETAAAVLAGARTLSSAVASQAELHGRYSGVVPELASRAHLARIAPVIEEAVSAAAPGASLADLARVADAVAFTRGPGLAGALLVGKAAASALAWAHGLPLVGVNHVEGHIFAADLEPGRGLEFPLVALVVSGGHTELVLAAAPGRYRVLGRTRDDAAGEAYDKVARLLGLGYPGGPAIDRLAARGDPAAVPLPRPLLPGTWDFSFSGLKTAVLYRVRGRPPAGEAEAADLAASFQEAVVETLVEKTFAAARRWRVPRVVVAGGVAANRRLRAAFSDRAGLEGVEAVLPEPGLCTDNAAMIARVGGLMLEARARSRRPRLAVDPALPLGSWA